MVGLIARVGFRVRRFLFLFGNLAWLLARSLRASLELDRKRSLVVLEQTLQQVRFTGLDAWPFVLFAGFGLGAITIIQAYTQLSSMAERYLGSLLVVIVVRELGPLTAAVLVIGRSGTAIAADLGSMRLNQEVDALEAFGVDPFQYLLLPRLLGVSFSLFGMPMATFTRAIGDTLDNVDLALAVLKGTLFGVSVALIACYYGLGIQRSQTEVPQAVTRTVVVSLSAVLIIDSLIATLVYA